MEKIGENNQDLLVTRRGADNNDAFRTRPGQSERRWGHRRKCCFRFEAIDQFSIAANASAEMGRNGGGVINMVIQVLHEPAIRGAGVAASSGSFSPRCALAQERSIRLYDCNRRSRSRTYVLAVDDFLADIRLACFGAVTFPLRYRRLLQIELFGPRSRPPFGSQAVTKLMKFVAVFAGKGARFGHEGRAGVRSCQQPLFPRQSWGQWALLQMISHAQRQFAEWMVDLQGLFGGYNQIRVTVKLGDTDRANGLSPYSGFVESLMIRLPLRISM
jgi:hypothetical protein